jgi:hypothetical protein
MAAPSFEEFQQQENSVPSFAAFEQGNAPAAKVESPSALSSAFEGMKAGVIPELARFAERKALGLKPEPEGPKDQRPLSQQAKDAGKAILAAIKKNPGSTLAYLGGNMLTDAPVVAAMNLVPGVGEAADAAWLARVAKALTPAAKAAALAGGQSATQQLGERGRVSGAETAQNAALGAALPIAGTVLKAPINAMAKAQKARSAERALAVDRAKDLGLNPLPEEAAGKKGADAGASISRSMTPAGEAMSHKQAVQNAEKINQTINEQAGISGNKANAEEVTRNLDRLGKEYGSKIRPEKEIKPNTEFYQTLHQLDQEAAGLPLNANANKVIDRMLDVVSPEKPGATVSAGDKYLKLRGELRANKIAALRAEGGATAAAFYQKASKVMDKLFDDNLAAQGKTQELADIKDLRAKLTANHTLEDLVHKGGVHDGHYDAQALFKLLNADPNSRVSTKLWDKMTPMEKVAHVSSELGIDHPYPDPTSRSHSIWPNAPWLSHMAASVNPKIAAATLAGSAYAVHPALGVGTAGALLAYPYLWKYAPELAKLNMAPAAPYVGAAAQSYGQLP